MTSPYIVENPLTEGEIQKILVDLNEYFIFSKGRALPIEKRYSGFYDKENFENLFIVKHLEQIIAFMGVKTQKIKVSNQEELNLFFVGSVFTIPVYRGRGLSMLLLNHISDKYLKNGMDGGMLWTTIHDFYKRLGWENCDNGVFIIASNPKTDVAIINNLQCEISNSVESFEVLNDLRKSLFNNYIDRVNRSYQTVPSPAEETRILIIRQNGDEKILGYMIFGSVNKNCYFYEITGVSTEIKRLLLSNVIQSFNFESFYFNLFREDESIELIKDMFANFEMKEQQLGMFIGSPEIKEKLKQVYIPFIDRI